MKNKLFGLMSLNLKTVFIMDYGLFLAKRRFLNYTIFLIKVGNSFVELWYNMLQRSITNIEVQKDPVALTLYLQGIDFSELDKLLHSTSITRMPS